MFCAFDGPALTLRLYGRGHTVLPGEPEWIELASHFTLYANTRQLIVADIDRVQTSCGFGVPIYEYAGRRNELFDWADEQGEASLAAYQQEHSLRSIDGLPSALDAHGKTG
jgi:hypothetical protein